MQSFIARILSGVVRVYMYKEKKVKLSVCVIYLVV